MSYRQTSNIRLTSVGNKIVDHSDEALLPLHLHSRLNAWLQWIRQRQLQGERRIILVLLFGASDIEDFMVSLVEIIESLKSQKHVRNDVELLMNECYFLEIDWKQNNTKNQNMRHNSAEECRIFLFNFDQTTKGNS